MMSATMMMRRRKAHLGSLWHGRLVHQQVQDVECHQEHGDGLQRGMGKTGTSSGAASHCTIACLAR